MQNPGATGSAAVASPSFDRAAPIAALAVTLAACGDSPAEPPPPPEEVRVVVVSPTASPQARRFDVTLTGPARVQVDFWTEEGPRLRVTGDDPAQEHRLALGSLRAGATYQFEVRSMDERGESLPVTGSFTTDPLPDDLAAFELTAEGTPSQRLTLHEVNRSPVGFEGVFIADDEGEVVWYHRVASVAGTTRRANGNFVILSGERGLVEVAPTGEVVRELPQPPEPGARMHHDVIATPANTLLFIALDTRTFEGREISGESIWEWNPGAGPPVRRWSSWDQLSPATDWAPASRDSDWLHANSISIGPDGNVLMSLRFTDQVISISPDYSELEWRLGGLNADVEVSGDDVFIGQHTAAELPAVDGRRRVLLFDNGPRSGRGFSRALELELDVDAGAASGVWEFRPTPDNLSFIVSLARRLPNGNTFVSFGAGEDVLGSFGPVEAFEVDPAGMVRFRLEVGGEPAQGGLVVYRTWPVANLLGEERVESE